MTFAQSFSTDKRRLGLLLSGFIFSFLAGSVRANAATEAEFDLVFKTARVLDPETQLDAVRNVGIREGVIRAVSAEDLRGREIVNASGLVLSPGFIDLHQHGHNIQDYWLKAKDGVTTICEFEIGTSDIDAWYAAREGKTPLNFGVSIGHIPVRMAVLGETPAFLPAAGAGSAERTLDAPQLAELKKRIKDGLRRGAPAVGMGLQYTPGANSWETVEVFRTAADFKAACHVHMRFKGEHGPQNVFSAVMELVAASSLTGAPAHVCHVQSTANRHTPRVLELISDARRKGLDISVECYPYTAGLTDIKSSIFNPGWQETAEISYSDLQWVATGERLTQETFERYRRSGGMVIVHSNTEETVRSALSHPLTMIASDGIPGHPRNAGTCARVLGRYVREMQCLTMLQAVEKLSLLPARRLESRVPELKRKGRIQPGADADLVLFDPQRALDQATYDEPNIPSAGIVHVLVNGGFVVRDGVAMMGSVGGRPVRAPVEKTPE